MHFRAILGLAMVLLGVATRDRTSSHAPLPSASTEQKSARINSGNRQKRMPRARICRVRRRTTLAPTSRWFWLYQSFCEMPAKNPRRAPNCGAKTLIPLPSRSSYVLSNRLTTSNRKVMGLTSGDHLTSFAIPAFTVT